MWDRGLYKEDPHDERKGKELFCNYVCVYVCVYAHKYIHTYIQNICILQSLFLSKRPFKEKTVKDKKIV